MELMVKANARWHMKNRRAREPVPAVYGGYITRLSSVLYHLLL